MDITSDGICNSSIFVLEKALTKINKSKVQCVFLVNSNDDEFYNDEILNLGGRIYYIEKYRIMNYYRYTAELKSCGIFYNMLFRFKPELSLKIIVDNAKNLTLILINNIIYIRYILKELF